MKLTRREYLDRITSAQPHAFVVYAYSNADGWQCTRHGGATMDEALDAERLLLGNDASWMLGKRETRIVAK